MAWVNCARCGRAEVHVECHACHGKYQEERAVTVKFVVTRTSTGGEPEPGLRVESVPSHRHPDGVERSVVEFEAVAGLMAWVATVKMPGRYRGIVIHAAGASGYSLPEIEIYDDYRE